MDDALFVPTRVTIAPTRSGRDFQQTEFAAIEGSALSSVFGTSPDDVWAVGNGSGVVVRST